VFLARSSKKGAVVTASKRPRPLGREDRVDGFESGVRSLDTWLVRYARIADAAGSARTYVTTAGGRVVGYCVIGAVC